MGRYIIFYSSESDVMIIHILCYRRGFRKHVCPADVTHTSYYISELIGKAQWNAQVKKLRIFSSTARIVAQQGMPVEVDEAPGVYISPGNETLTFHPPTILEITIPSDIGSGNPLLINDS